MSIIGERERAGLSVTWVLAERKREGLPVEGYPFLLRVLDIASSNYSSTASIYYSRCRSSCHLIIVLTPGTVN